MLINPTELSNDAKCMICFEDLLKQSDIEPLIQNKGDYDSLHEIKKYCLLEASINKKDFTEKLSDEIFNSF